MLQGNGWIMGSQYTVVNLYALIFYGWGVAGGFPMKELGGYTAWQERMMQRPTVRKSVESEQSVSTWNSLSPKIVYSQNSDPGVTPGALNVRRLSLPAASFFRSSSRIDWDSFSR